MKSIESTQAQTSAYQFILSHENLVAFLYFFIRDLFEIIHPELRSHHSTRSLRCVQKQNKNGTIFDVIYSFSCWKTKILFNFNWFVVFECVICAFLEWREKPESCIRKCRKKEKAVELWIAVHFTTMPHTYYKLSGIFMSFVYRHQEVPIKTTVLYAIFTTNYTTNKKQK